MKNKVLINIESIQTKKLILSTIVGMNLDFVEVKSLEDLIFKNSLLQEDVLAYVHELNYHTYDADFKTVKYVSEINIPSMLIVDSYSTMIIDDSLKVGVNDVLVQPIQREIFKNKLQAMIADNQIEINETTKHPEVLRFNKDCKEIIELEIARANRGGYSLLCIMIQLQNAEESDQNLYIDELKKRLRNTDQVIKYNEQKLLVICPFTDKESVVEVEGKVRAVHEELFVSNKKNIQLIMYGIAYPTDGESSEQLLEKLKDGIHNSMIIGNIKGTLSQINREQIEKYKSMFRI